MGSLNPFKKPDLPSVPKGPTAAELSAASEKDKQGRREQRGRASTILTGDDVSKTGGVLGDDLSGLKKKKSMGM